MKVLYDHQAFFIQDAGGVSRYFFELMNQYQINKLCDFQLPIVFSNNDYLLSSNFSKPISLFKKNMFIRRSKAYRVFNKFGKIYQRLFLKYGDYDVFHPTAYDSYFLNSLHKKPFVLTIHDMTHEVYPEFFSPNDKTSEVKKLLAKKASRIIAVSENTKKDIIRILGINKNKIDVVYHGNSVVGNGTSWQRPKELDRKYILFVGNRLAYKNFEFTLKSLASVLIEKKLLLVCAGGGKFSLFETKLINDLNLKEKVLQFPIDDSSLRNFYENAELFIFPSLYEGFGIPILEAFSAHCPVALSKSSSFPEVALDCAEYFNPTNEKSIQKAVLKILEDKTYSKKLVKKGLNRARDFSWQKCSVQTMEVYKKAVLKIIGANLK